MSLYTKEKGRNQQANSREKVPVSVGKACGAAYPLQLCKILREVLRRYAAKVPAAC